MELVPGGPEGDAFREVGNDVKIGGSISRTRHFAPGVLELSIGQPLQHSFDLTMQRGATRRSCKDIDVE